MTWPPNKLTNSSQHKLWCVYSRKAPNGGWDVWTTRILHEGYTSAWKVDIDYIIAKPDGVTINGRPGWWKLGQGEVFMVGDDSRNGKNLILAGRSSGSVRYYTDWAKGVGRKWYERGGKDTPQEIAAQIAEWESVRDYGAPIE
jgi:hypothetical protein